MRAHTYNPSTRGLSQEGHEFNVGLGYIERPRLRKEEGNEKGQGRWKNSGEGRGGEKRR